ncbi:unnamed protein product [Closterium sp. Naga37s-1]|nr:unnamed protein product [Closterium sp. Naga37s-1]
MVATRLTTQPEELHTSDAHRERMWAAPAQPKLEVTDSVARRHTARITLPRFPIRRASFSSRFWWSRAHFHQKSVLPSLPPPPPPTIPSRVHCAPAAARSSHRPAARAPAFPCGAPCPSSIRPPSLTLLLSSLLCASPHYLTSSSSYFLSSPVAARSYLWRALPFPQSAPSPSSSSPLSHSFPLHYLTPSSTSFLYSSAAAGS